MIWSAARTRPERLMRLFAAAVLSAVLGAVLPVGGWPAAAAQVNSPQPRTGISGGYAPCEAGQDVDLLIMMDASGSLNGQRSGIDPGGLQRREALERFRDNLTGLLSGLPEDDAAEVRVALWRFDRDVRQIASFGEPSHVHPADEDILLSLGDRGTNGRFAVRGRDTDYVAALRAVTQAFRDGSDSDACRLLLFFTDGLHDPVGRPTVAQADELRREVCGPIKNDFEAAGIDTYTILLGDHFSAATAGDNETATAETGTIRQTMATASMQAIRALTGDANSRLVRGLPYGDRFGCRQWSDEQPASRAGAIVQIGALEQLALQLLEVSEVAARGLVEWTDCGALPGHGAQSAPMPAGRFIDSIVAYPRGASISGYEIVAATGATRHGSGSGGEPLRLGNEELADLDAGWTIEFVTAGDGDGISVSCYVKQNQEPVAPVAGRVTDADGQTLDTVRRSTAGADSAPLNVQVTAEAPVALCDADRATVIVDSDHQRVVGWHCADDGTEAVFDLEPLDCGERHDLAAPLRLSYEPRHSDALFPTADRTVAAEITLDGPASVLYDCLGAPVLTCGADTDGRTARPDADRQTPDGLWPMTVEPDSVEVPHEPLTGTSSCVLRPPTHGTAHLEAAWRPDVAAVLPNAIDWAFDTEFHQGTLTGTVDVSGRRLSLDASADPAGVTLRFVTADELGSGSWEIAGRILLIPTWDPDADAPDTGISGMQAGVEAQMNEQRAEIWVQQDYEARSNSMLAFWLTLLLLVLSVLLSYALFCAALVRSMSLPDPAKFWLYHTKAPLSRDTRGRLSFGPESQTAIAAAKPQRIDASRHSNSRRITGWRAEGLTVRLRRAPRWWLFGLLRGPWSSVSAESVGEIEAHPPTRRRSREPGQAFAAADFNVLEVVGSPHLGPDGAHVAAVWIARPKHGPRQSPQDTDMRALSDLMHRMPSAADASPDGMPADSAGRSPSGSPEDSDADRRPQQAPPGRSPAEQPPMPLRDRPLPRTPRDRPPPRDGR